MAVQQIEGIFLEAKTDVKDVADDARPTRSISIFEGVRRARQETGKSRWAIFRGWLRLRRSGRKLLFSEYLAFGLYRKGAKPGAFLGVIEATKLSLALNHRSHRRALVSDKLLFDAILRGMGYPVPRLQALLSPHRHGGGFASLKTARDILDFLEKQAEYPIFCKPVRGQGGQDSFAIRHQVGREIEFLDGTREETHLFAERLFAEHRAGMVMQDFVRQHPDLTAVCGEVVGTVRLFTFWEGRDIHVIDAAWKIPTGGGMADNLGYGSFIGQVDVGSGRVGTVRVAVAPGADSVTHHPVSGAELTGLALPHWQAAKDVCCQAARLLYGMPLVGWDVAIGENGPVLIEANSIPGLEAVQYLDLEGFLQNDLLGRMEREIARLTVAAKREARGRHRKVREMAKDRVLQGLGFDR